MRSSSKPTRRRSAGEPYELESRLTGETGEAKEARNKTVRANEPRTANRGAFREEGGRLGSGGGELSFEDTASVGVRVLHDKLPLWRSGNVQTAP